MSDIFFLENENIKILIFFGVLETENSADF